MDGVTIKAACGSPELMLSLKYNTIISVRRRVHVFAQGAPEREGFTPAFFCEKRLNVG